MSRLPLLAFLVAFPVAALAQTKLPVFLVSEIDPRDDAAQKVLKETRDALAASPQFRLAGERQWPYLKLTIRSARADGEQSVMAHAVVYDSHATKLSGVLASFGLNQCNAAKAEYCARNIVGDVELAVDRLRREAPELYGTMR